MTLTASDGHPLRGDWFPPPGPPRGAVLIVPAMATPVAHYHPFAAWLQGHGFAVLSFDFRGHGASANGSMRTVDADMWRWAGDARDALDQLAAWAGGAPLTWVGHSLGGQLLPFVDHGRLARAVTVATGNAYWGLYPRRNRWRAPLLWHVIAPLTTRLWGYFPGRRLGVIGDLPAGVMRQWRRWCLHPDYVAGAEQAYADFSKVRTPIAAFSFADDELTSEQAVESLHRWYDHATVIRHHYTPAQLEVQRMGHFGFFRERHAWLWDELVLPVLATRRTTPARGVDACVNVESAPNSEL